MSLQIIEEDGGKLLVIRASGKLVKSDYETFIPEFERLARKHGKLQVLFDMSDFHGWEAAALWEDLKFDVHHFHDIERLAMVGDKKWQQWMASFCKPFTKAEIKYFDHSEAAQAFEWLQNESAVANFKEK